MASSEQFDNEPDTLRAELRVYRAKRGLTQKQVGARLGMSQARVSAFERGVNHSLRPDKLKLLKEIVRQDQSGEERPARDNILEFAKLNSSLNREGSSSSEKALKNIMVEMKAIILRTIGADSITVDLVDGMSQEELFRAYLLADRIEFTKS